MFKSVPEQARLLVPGWRCPHGYWKHAWYLVASGAVAGLAMKLADAEDINAGGEDRSRRTWLWS
jgi:hypothetical protein